MSKETESNLEFPGTCNKGTHNLLFKRLPNGDIEFTLTVGEESTTRTYTKAFIEEPNKGAVSFIDWMTRRGELEHEHCQRAVHKQIEALLKEVMAE